MSSWTALSRSKPCSSTAPRERRCESVLCWSTGEALHLGLALGILVFALRLRWCWRAPDEIGRRGLHERGAQALFPIVDAARHLALDIVHELIHLALHLFDFAPQVEDDFHTGEIHTEIARQRENRLELFEILLRVQARIAFGSRRLEQALTLVQAQCLRMDIVLLRHRADHVVRLAAFSPLCHVTLLARSRRSGGRIPGVGPSSVRRAASAA